jgi:prepilin-type N-terminal cleavage/methylation domain-containing protein
MKKLQKQQSGFTIIEVLIVLAIAGLIMLIVFLAVPALQRNSRNTQARSNASNVLGGVGEYVAANNGQLPTGVGTIGADGSFQLTGPTGTNPVTVRVQPGSAVSLGTANPAVTATNTFVLGTNRKCNGNSMETGTNPTPRAYAVGFNVETGSSNAPQCASS